MKKVAIIGYGVVGKAMGKIFPEAILYDIKDFTGGVCKNSLYQSRSEYHPNFNETIEDYQKRINTECGLAIICLPTPPMGMNVQRVDEDEKEWRGADLSLIYEAVKWLETDFILIKSTIPPGTTESLRELTKKHIVFSPEYLGESKYYTPDKYLDPTDPRKHGFMIIGGYKSDVIGVYNYFIKQLGPTTKFTFMTETEAELAKYMENTFFATKVTFFNTWKDICDQFGASYEVVREGFLLDPRIGPMHTAVFDDERGFGGKCLVAGSKLENEEGEVVDIQDVEVGDEIFDGNEKFTKVLVKAERVVDRTIKINVGGRIIHGSEDHIQLIKDKENNLIETELKNASINDFVYIPKPRGLDSKKIELGKKPNGYIKWWLEEFEWDADWARVIGLYLAEGCSSSDYSVIWSFGEREEYLANEVFEILKNKGLVANKKLQINNGTYGESRCWIVRCRSYGLQHLFNVLGLGKNASEKDCPILCGENAKILIGGWLDGDGCLSKTTIEGASKSEALIRKIDRMLLSLGIVGNISIMVNDAYRIRISRKEYVREVAGWCKRLKFDESIYLNDTIYASPTVKEFNDGWFVKIKSVEEMPGETVYSIETESHIYVANGILTHNCLPKDLLAIIAMCEEKGYSADLLKEVWNTNKQFLAKNKNENIDKKS